MGASLSSARAAAAGAAAEAAPAEAAAATVAAPSAPLLGGPGAAAEGDSGCGGPSGAISLAALSAQEGLRATGSERRGILKRRRPSAAEAPASLSSRSLLLRRWVSGFCRSGMAPEEPGRRITFAPNMRVVEYRRAMGGSDTVPQDGSLLPMGLGRRRRSLSEPMAAPTRRRGQVPIEDRCYVPVRERVQMLRKAMGDARFSSTWARCKGEISRTLRSRKASKKDPETKRFEYMPTSMFEARGRAAHLAREVRAASASAAATGGLIRRRSAEDDEQEAQKPMRATKRVKIQHAQDADGEKVRAAAATPARALPRPARGGA